MRPMQRSTHPARSRLSTVLVFAWSAWAIGTASGIEREGWAQSPGCVDTTHGCYKSMPVPCRNATCAYVGMYEDQKGIPTCSNKPGGAGPAWMYNETVTATSWFNCSVMYYWQGGACAENLDQCSTVKFWADDACTTPCLPNSNFTYVACEFGVYAPPLCTPGQ